MYPSSDIFQRAVSAANVVSSNCTAALSDSTRTNSLKLVIFMFKIRNRMFLKVDLTMLFPCHYYRPSTLSGLYHILVPICY